MDHSAFSDRSSGTLIPTVEDQYAFVPNPLPPHLDITAELARTLEEATLAIGELSGLSGFVPNADLISRPLLTREAIYSSRIEGTYASAEDLALAGARSPSISEYSDTWEVLNYLDATSAGMRRIRTEQVGLDLIRDLHRRLFGRLFSRGTPKTPGEFRTVQNWIGVGMARSISQARFIPPPPEQMIAGMEEIETYIRSDSSHPALIRLGLIHYQFEAVHPFIDGNGRIGRMLVTLLLAQWGLLRQPILHLSTYFERHRETYIDLLLKVSTDGSWNEWIAFFLDGVANQAREAIRRIRELVELRQSYHDRVRMPKASALLPVLIDSLFERQVISIPEAAKLLEVSYPSARQNVYRLVDAGILQESYRTGPGNAKLFGATEIMRLADDPN